MSSWWRIPAGRATGILVAVVLSGFVSFGLAWRGTSGLLAVPLQLPWVVSGGLGGAALIGAGLGFLDIHLARRRAARYRSELDLVIHEAEMLAERLLSVYTANRRG